MPPPSKRAAWRSKIQRSHDHRHHKPDRGQYTIVTVRDGANESLAVNLGTSGLMSSYNAATGTLTLSGSASVATYESVLETVKYNDAAANPITATRNIQFTVTDANNLKSNVAVATVSFLGTYTEASGPASAVNPTVIIDSGSVVNCCDRHQRHRGDQQRVCQFDRGRFGPQQPVPAELRHHACRLRCRAKSCSPAPPRPRRCEYQLELDAITYTNTSHYFPPSDLQKTFTFTIFNGSAYSTSDVKTYNITPVNTNPTVTTTTGPLSYTALSGAQTDRLQA